MNCKPGERAIIVRVMPRNPDALGMIVDVLAVGMYEFGDGVQRGYRIRTPRPLRGYMVGRATVGLVRYETLRPIRDPGDDAVDETLRSLPAPSAETAAA